MAMIKNSRIVSLNGEVNEISALEVIVQMLELDAKDNKEPIHLYINSPGGSIIHGLAIYDTINNIDAPVYTYCYGLAASMGAFLLCCGEKGHRYAGVQPLLQSNHSGRATVRQARSGSHHVK